MAVITLPEQSQHYDVDDEGDDDDDNDVVAHLARAVPAGHASRPSTLVASLHHPSVGHSHHPHLGRDEQLPIGECAATAHIQLNHDILRHLHHQQGKHLLFEHIGRWFLHIPRKRSPAPSWTVHLAALATIRVILLPLHCCTQILC